VERLGTPTKHSETCGVPCSPEPRARSVASVALTTASTGGLDRGDGGVLGDMVQSAHDAGPLEPHGGIRSARKGGEPCPIRHPSSVSKKSVGRWTACCRRRPRAPIAVAIAIVDDQGELVSFARMDRCAPQPRVIARKKAYTAARTRTDTKAYADRLKSQGRSVTEFGDRISLPRRVGW